MMLDKIVNSKTEEYINSGNKLSDQTETEMTSVKDKVQAAIDSGEISNWQHNELVAAYMQLAGPLMNEKKRSKLKVKLIKTPKKLLISMLTTALKMS